MEEFMKKSHWYYNNYFSLFQTERFIAPVEKDLSPAQAIQQLTAKGLQRTADYYTRLYDDNKVIGDGSFPKQESHWGIRYYTILEVKNKKCTLQIAYWKQWINPYGTAITGLFTIVSILISIRLHLNERKRLAIAACTILSKLSIDIYLRPTPAPITF